MFVSINIYIIANVYMCCMDLFCHEPLKILIEIFKMKNDI